MQRSNGGVDEEEKIYVAVIKKMKDWKANLVWAVQTSGGNPICILHVHQPDQMIPTAVGYMPVDGARRELVEAHRVKERAEMSQVLDEYVQYCKKKAGVTVDKLYTESSSVEEGIIQLINQHNIRRLVMGAAADKHYQKKMMELRSKKAIYVRDNAPASCHISFVCKGCLIYTRASDNPNGKYGGANPTAPPFFSNPNWTPPRWSSDTNVSPGDSRSASGREQYGHLHQPSSDSRSSVSHNSSRRQSFQGTASPSRDDSVVTEKHLPGTVSESVYQEECRKRKEVEDELAKVKEQLEHMKNNVLAELRSTVEQKILLENQVGNCNVLLKMLGEKLASTINLVHHYEEQ